MILLELLCWVEKTALYLVAKKGPEPVLNVVMKSGSRGAQRRGGGIGRKLGRWVGVLKGDCEGRVGPGDGSIGSVSVTLCITH